MHMLYTVYMTVRQMLKKRRKDVIHLASKHGARNLRVFGSVVHEEERPDSDIDLLAILDDGVSLLDLVGLELDLGEMLDRKVEIVDERALSPYIRENVLREAVAL